MQDQLPFKIGDLVKLRSGGPVMTVLAADGDRNEITCVLFDKNEAHLVIYFPPEALVPA